MPQVLLKVQGLLPCSWDSWVLLCQLEDPNMRWLKQSPWHRRRNRPEAIHQKTQNWGLGCPIALESKGANQWSHWSDSCKDYLLQVAQPGTAPFFLSWLLTQHLKTPMKKSREKEEWGRMVISHPSNPDDSSNHNVTTFVWSDKQEREKRSKASGNQMD